MEPQQEATTQANASGAAAPEGDKKGGKKKVIAWVIVAIIIIALIAVILWLLFHKEEPPRRNVVVNQDNVDEVIEDMQNREVTDPSYYTVTMNNTWHFAAGDQPSSDAVVENSTMNGTDVYFDIVLAEDESHTVLSSPVLPVGSKLEGITLDEDLDAGTYPCICIYHLVDENQETLSTLRVELTLEIEG